MEFLKKLTKKKTLLHHWRERRVKWVANIFLLLLHLEFQLLRAIQERFVFFKQRKRLILSIDSENIFVELNAEIFSVYQTIFCEGLNEGVIPFTGCDGEGSG
jgi:hypothetical protein